MTTDTEPPVVDKAAELALLDELRARLDAIKYVGPGLLQAIVVAPKHDVHESRAEARVLPGDGVEGDGPFKKFWRGKKTNGREISAVNAEVLDALEVGYDIPGDNLIIRGIDLASVGSGEAIKVGDAVLIATGATHNPCKLFKERTSTPHYAAIAKDRKRGTMFDALHAATIKVGDAVERIVLEQ